MSIREPFAAAIFGGKKRFEFRRRVFRRSVDVIVVYVTSPVSRVIGEFEVIGVLRDDLSRLWRRTEQAAGIDRETFDAYFAGRSHGYAIEIGRVTRYSRPKSLTPRFAQSPPQFFKYLDQ